MSTLIPHPTLPLLRHAPFDDVPANLKVRSFGVEYIRLCECDGAVLYVTREGWPLVDYLLPERWYFDSLYLKIGKRLSGGTGMVYHAHQTAPNRRPVDLVIKFSRFAQEVPLFVMDANVAPMSAMDIASARFASPFEEFARLIELRATKNSAGQRMWTKRPLAIYSPPEKVEMWRTGRTMSRYLPYEDAIIADQQQLQVDPFHQVSLDVEREYVLLFSWIEGINAEDAYTRGWITHEQLLALTAHVTADLARRGFRVLDNKPRHYILRPHHRTGELLKRDGQWVYGLVDYELLEHIPGAKCR